MDSQRPLNFSWVSGGYQDNKMFRGLMPLNAFVKGLG